MRLLRIDSLAALRSLRVCDVMTPSPRTIQHDARVSEVMDLMERTGILHLPVMRDGKLAGLVTERHMRDAMPSVLALRDPTARRKSLEAVRVHQIWIPNPSTIEPRAFLTEAIRNMRRLRASSLPVVDAGVLVGIITSGDLLTVLDSALVFPGS